MAAKGSHLLSLWKSPPMDNIPPCSAVSITPVGETKYPTQTSWRPSNFVRQDRLGLAGHCHCLRSPELPASQLVLWQATHGHLRCGRRVSTFIETLMREGRVVSTRELSSRVDNRAGWAAKRLQ